jgi:hypothetical protein
MRNDVTPKMAQPKLVLSKHVKQAVFKFHLYIKKAPYLYLWNAECETEIPNIMLPINQFTHISNQI